MSQLKPPYPAFNAVPAAQGAIVPGQSSKAPVVGSTASDAIGLGRFMSKQGGMGGKMRYGGALPVVVFGVNGSGKGTRLLMPNLLQSSGSSIVVVDPKGELAAVTAPHRRTLGRVVILNPFGVLTDIPGYGDLTSCGFNPLVNLDPASPSFNTQASMLADALVTVESKDPHWTQSARALIAALLMQTAIDAKKSGQVPTMARFREMLCQASMEPSAANDWEGMGIPKIALEMMRSDNAGLRNKAAQFTDWNREIQAIVSTARIQTEPFDDYEIASDLAKNSFNFQDLKKTPTTVYLILPPEMMGRHSKWLRLVLTSAILAGMRPKKSGEPKILFMLDEFFALGHLEIISTVWALVRGYGIQIMPVLQDLNQLKKLYPDMWETFIGMAGAVASFPPNDRTTAEWLAHRTGETTELSISYSKNSGVTEGPGGASASSNSGYSYGTQKVPVLAAHQLRGLRAGSLLVSLNGLSDVVPGYAPPYYDILECERRARRNPYFLG